VVARHPHVKGVLYGHRHVEGLRIEGGTQWIASGKTTAAQGGQLALRTLELASGRVQVVTCPAAA
jgi:hypothetical protein